MQEYFPKAARTIPSLLYKRIVSHPYDILFIDKFTPLSPELQETIANIKKNHPSITIFIESLKNDTDRIIEITELNIDKLIFADAGKEVFWDHLQRALTPRYALTQNAKYEQHLEDIIFGQTRDLYVQQTSDLLTGFKNITGLKERFKESDHKGMLFLDIDKFDTINTLYGMRIGDSVLRFVAKRLAKFLPDNAELFRISADEFAVLVTNPQHKQLESLGQQLIAFFLEAPIVVNKLQFDVSFSVGFDYGDSYDIFYNAKLANREAKSVGGRICVGYKDDSRFLIQQKENHYWINEIKGALKEDRIEVYYQPMYDYAQKEVNKYEALVRLRTANGNIIIPHFFLKPAILSELITSISRVVIDKTFKTFSQNSHAFSLNLSDQDFAEGYLEEFLVYKCNHYGIEPSRVYIEILEETSMNCSSDFMEQVKRLRSLGFKFSIDDFGVEKSNFSRVMALEAEIIKIDGSFIQSLEKDKSSRIIIESIVNFAKKIGAKTVAEFVEKECTFNTLSEMGVDYAQGYLIGKPDPVLQCHLSQKEKTKG